MFGKKKLAADEAALELATYSQTFSLAALEQVLKASGQTNPDQVAYANRTKDRFGAMWPALVMAGGQRWKSGDAARLCGVGVSVLPAKLTAYPTLISDAQRLVEKTAALPGEERYSATVAALLAECFDELDFSAIRVPGIHYVSSMNYADFLVSHFKIVWP